jgi:glycosyltransferase involved in cell wall biosynthesis
MDALKVSVMILTFNQEKFIAQALDSVLEQQVSFSYEIIVSDDASTDHTPAILADYQSRYPDRIRLLQKEFNLGPYKNFFQTFFDCQGQYIAYLEGDDYWTSPEKLQKQVSFLETHPDCTLCFHNAKSISEENLWEPVIYCPDTLKEISTIKELFLGNFIPSVSVMYRRGTVQEIPGWMSKLGMSDWPLHLLHAQQGNLGYINEVMGIYRIHAKGIWSCLSEARKFNAISKMLETINIYFDYQYETIINDSLANFSNQLIAAAQHPLQQDLDRLDRTLTYERSESQNHIQHLQNELGNAQTGLTHYQNELTHLQSQHSQLQGVLAYTQSQFLQTQAEIHSLQQLLHHHQATSQTRIEELKERLQEKRQRLKQKRTEIEDYQKQIAAMEASKFWKLRKGWFRVKRSLGIPIDE